MGKSFGRHIVSIYNDKMHRVELIQEIDRAKAREFDAQDVVDRLDAGENPPVSMGLRTPYDICSICGNKCYSAKPEDYCKCIQLFKGRILNDGRKVCMINPHAKFFDMSYVLIGADPSAFAVAKIASVTPPREPEVIHISSGVEKTAALRKVTKVASDKRTLIMESFQKKEKPLPNKLINDLAAHPVSEALSSLGSMGIVLKPREFQRLVLVHDGKENMADELDSCNGIFCSGAFGQPEVPMPLNNGSVQARIVISLDPHVEDRSILNPYLKERVSGFEMGENEEKDNFFRNPILDVISKAYSAYRLALLYKIDELLKNGALQSPRIITKLAADNAGLSNELRKTAGVEKNITTLGVLPVVYLLTHALQGATGDTRSTLRKIIEDHPYVSYSVLKGILTTLS
jgi:hypothetical protein